MLASIPVPGSFEHPGALKVISDKFGLRLVRGRRRRHEIADFGVAARTLARKGSSRQLAQGKNPAVDLDDALCRCSKYQGVSTGSDNVCSRHTENLCT